MRTAILSMLCGVALALGLILPGCNTPSPAPVGSPLTMTNGQPVHLDIVPGRAE